MTNRHLTTRGSFRFDFTPGRARLSPPSYTKDKENTTSGGRERQRKPMSTRTSGETDCKYCTIFKSRIRTTLHLILKKFCSHLNLKLHELHEHYKSTIELAKMNTPQIISPRAHCREDKTDIISTICSQRSISRSATNFLELSPCVSSAFGSQAHNELSVSLLYPCLPGSL